MADILTYGGVGDTFALNYYIPPDVCAAVKTVYTPRFSFWRVRDIIPYLFTQRVQLATLPDCSNDRDRGYCLPFNELRRRLRKLPEFHDVRAATLRKLRRANKLHPHQHGVLLSNISADLSRFNLPPSYVVVHPYSAWCEYANRNLTGEELLMIHRQAEASGYPVVVVGRDDKEGYVPQPRGSTYRAHITGYHQIVNSYGWYNLINSTSQLECAAIVTGAAAFIGAASGWSVLAAMALPQTCLAIKGHKEVRTHERSFYYPYLTASDVLVDDIRRTRFPELRH